MKKTVAVDLDGVISEYHGWKGFNVFGDPIQGAKEFLEKVREKYRVLIFTTRCNIDRNREHLWKVGALDPRLYLQECIGKWMRDHDLPYDDIYAGQGKPIACAIVDDRAVLCQPQKDPEAFEKAITMIGSFDGMYDDGKLGGGK